MAYYISYVLLNISTVAMWVRKLTAFRGVKMKAIIINGKTINPYENGLADFNILKAKMVGNAEVALYLIQYMQWRGKLTYELISLFDGSKSSFEKGNNLDKFYEFRGILVKDTYHAYSEDVFDILRVWTIAAINQSWRTWFLK